MYTHDQYLAEPDSLDDPVDCPVCGGEVETCWACHGDGIVPRWQAEKLVAEKRAADADLNRGE